ncbi:MAG: hypothetical protein CMP39_01365 [Rickettsiales bacterium]|nr:hypothetical protein [Rickettsiales bacterium]
MPLPIILAHQGKKSITLELVLKQLRQSNPTTKIYFLTDDEFPNLDFISIVNSNEHSKLANEFAKSYTHMSDKNEEQTLFNIQRWFLIYDFMKVHNIDKAMILNTNTLLYTSVSVIEEKVENLSSLIVPEQTADLSWEASGHCSIWFQHHLLQLVSFIDIIYSSKLFLLKRKWDWHQKQNISGGISEETLLYLFYKDYPSYFYNSLVIENNSCMDVNIRHHSAIIQREIAAEKVSFLTNGALKKIKFRQKKPYGLKVVSKNTVAFHTIHLGDNSNYLIYRFYTGPKPMFFFLKVIIFYLLGLVKKA